MTAADIAALGGPVLTREQVRRVDQIAIDRYGVPGIVLMENAARGATDRIRSHFVRLWKADTPPKMLILCGGGNNGGDGLAIARHLHNCHADVHVGLCTDPARYAGDALVNWRIVQAMRLPVFDAAPPALGRWMAEHRPDLIVDAIFGTGLTAPPRDPFPQLVDGVERSGTPVVAVDLPSGLDCDAGRPLGERAVRARLTVTFVGIKQGFLAPGADHYTGQIDVVGIGCPKEAEDEAVQTA